MKARAKILTLLYRLTPFSLKGDLQTGETDTSFNVSCIINFCARVDLLEGILYSLLDQDLPKERYEVILVEDRGGTAEGSGMARRFDGLLNIRYFPLTENHGKMGYSRNFALSKARSRYVLFLDDDTVLLQKDFLSTLVDKFEQTGASAIVPNGSSNYCLLKGRYGFHDDYFPSNRCMAYTRKILEELGGFVSEIVGQEDVEFVIRFIASGNSFHQADQLGYLHPPLIVNGLGKPASVGFSFAHIRKRYSLFVWLMLLLNGIRYVPLLLVPLTMKWRMQGKFSLGFLIGILYSAVGKRVNYC